MVVNRSILELIIKLNIIYINNFMVVKRCLILAYNSLSHEEYITKLKNKPNNTVFPIEQYVNHLTPIKHICIKCNSEWITTPRTLLCSRRNLSGCVICNNYVRTVRLEKNVNDLWGTHPGIAKLLVNPDDGYKYSHGSTKRLDFKCPVCGNVKNISIECITSNGFSCEKCNDGVGIPEKFMANFLFMNNINYIHNRVTEWSNNKRYDFIINDNIIIETHGSQHYEEKTYFSYKNNVDLKSIIKNDIYKKELALNNGIQYYIEIDCRESSLNWIKNSIFNSNIPKLFNLNLDNFGWNNCYLKSMKSLLVECCELFKNKIPKKEISKLLNISMTTVREYLKTGINIGILKNVNINSNIRNIICVTTGEIFNMIIDAEKKYNNTCIEACCRGMSKYAGVLNGKPLIWKYLDDYDENIDYTNLINSTIINNFCKPRKVKCTTTNKIFNSVKKAATEYNICSSGIVECCKGKFKTSGKLSDGTKLEWEYI
jgi:predicted transcriptional regulator